MSALKKVTANTVWQLGSKIANSLSGLIIIGLITRYFGEQGIGIYTLVLGYIAFFFMPVDFGLNAIAVKHLLDKDRSAKKIFGNLLGMRITIAVIVTGIALFIILLLPYNPVNNTGYSLQVKVGVFVQILTVLAQAILATTNAYFQANHKYKYSFIANAISAIFNTLLISILITSGLPLIYTLASFTLSALIGAASALYLVNRNLQGIKIRIDRQYWRELFSQTVPLTISIILNLVYFRIDSLVLPFYRQIKEVGHYNVAYKIFDTLLVLPSYFANAIYPVMLERYAQSHQAFKNLITKSAFTLAGLSICASIIMYIVAPLAVRILLNNYNAETILYLRILSSGLILFFLSSIATWSLIIINKQKYLSYIYGITMLINIALNVSLIPKYGALASAYTTIATEGVVLLATATLLALNLQRENKNEK